MAPKGYTFAEMCDLRKLTIKDRFLELYAKMKKELEDLAFKNPGPRHASFPSMYFSILSFTTSAVISSIMVTPVKGSEDTVL